MKFLAVKVHQVERRTLPTRGAWIEIARYVLHLRVFDRRSPPGERGLKYRLRPLGRRFLRRSPPGERGLKSSGNRGRCHGVRTLPTRGAWIEIHHPCICITTRARRSPPGERGLKSAPTSPIALDDATLPTRGARIEITASISPVLGSA